MIVNTTKGPMDTALLHKREGWDPPPPGPLGVPMHWVEYWLNGELVHRSAEGIISGQ